jgi:hypothetical protein
MISKINQIISTERFDVDGNLKCMLEKYVVIYLEVVSQYITGKYDFCYSGTINSPSFQFV